MFRSLAVPNYRFYVMGQMVSVIGTWIQRVAQDWLVLDLSDSAVALGIATALQFVPMLLFGLWGGVLVDRLDRRRTIMTTQAVSGVLAVAVLTGVVQLWMVYVLALCLGFVTVLDVPARQAFVTEPAGVVDRRVQRLGVDVSSRRSTSAWRSRSTRSRSRPSSSGSPA
ncbi:MAG: MFS transporter [Actinophytocola sp.]|uniref:MFS transporter n=1 Tax=Actinophytocola sp. TaxID=1872138 RepID=UPI00132A2982|nr:MFS transporter [Actinophytocola sp.]MPZ82507.1 MFS transporter [Actinophytocola sp.]